MNDDHESFAKNGMKISQCDLPWPFGLLTGKDWKMKKNILEYYTESCVIHSCHKICGSQGV